MWVRGHPHEGFHAAWGFAGVNVALLTHNAMQPFDPAGAALRLFIS